jgi:hypothetical protein
MEVYLQNCTHVILRGDSSLENCISELEVYLVLSIGSNVFL